MCFKFEITILTSKCVIYLFCTEIMSFLSINNIMLGFFILFLILNISSCSMKSEILVVLSMNLVFFILKFKCFLPLHMFLGAYHYTPLNFNNIVADSSDSVAHVFG